jgi:hypothetical protein
MRPGVLALVAVGVTAPLLPLVAEAQARAPALSTDTIVQRYATARGGLTAIKAIRSLKMSGTLRPGGFDVVMKYDETVSRPGSVRIDATLQGLTVVQSYDGATGWQIQPFQGRKDPADVSADDAKSLAEEADFETPLIDAAAKGARIENLGVTDIDDAPAYVLHVTLKNGDDETWYIDPDVFLPVRMVTHQKVRGSDVYNQTDYGDYEKVAGVYFPFEVASGPKGSTVQQRVTYETVEANTPVDPGAFARPAAPAATPAAGAPSATPKAPSVTPEKPKSEKPGTPPPAPASTPKGE